MKSIVPVFRMNRRVLLASLAALPMPALLRTTSARAQDTASPLASWNDGPAKQAIIDFVRATTDRSSPKFVPPEDRIATFDQDGTLWVEHPMYSQMVYCLDRVPVLAAQKPPLRDEEPFKTVLSGNDEAIAKLSTPDLEKIILTTLTGITTDEFSAEVKKWLASAKDRRWKRPYTDLTYKPMREVLNCANGFKTFIVTGFGQDFVRESRKRSMTFRPRSDRLGAGGQVCSSVEIRVACGRHCLRVAQQSADDGQAFKRPSSAERLVRR
jgi:hypothetical protein